MKIIQKDLIYNNDIMAGQSSSKAPKEIGARLRLLRQAAGLSQTQLAKQLEIPQRTLSFYEVDADYIPSSLIVSIAHVLGVSVEQVLGVHKSSPKRGPKSHLERQFEIVSQLPRHQQKNIIEVVNALVAQHSNGRSKAF